MAKSITARHVAELEAENEKLREELVFERCENGWAREFLNRMGPKCGTKDCSSLVAYVTKLESDNAKLREQVAKLREQVGEACMQLGGAWVRCTELMELARFIMHQCNDGNPRCNECIDWNDGECVALQRIRELGIEVDA